jgi:hypothetical protein
MSSGFNVYRKLETGEIVRVAWRPDLAAAEALLRALRQDFPGTYGVEEALSEPTAVRADRPQRHWRN